MHLPRNHHHVPVLMQLNTSSNHHHENVMRIHRMPEVLGMPSFGCALSCIGRH